MFLNRLRAPEILAELQEDISIEFGYVFKISNKKTIELLCNTVYHTIYHIGIECSLHI